MEIRITTHQQKIIEAARSIVIQKGMSHLTVREIGKEIGVTDGALYRHFRSKREILALLIEDIERTLLASIGSAAMASDDPEEKLWLIFRSHLSYAEKRKGMTFLVINETLSIDDKTLRRKMFNVVSQYLATIRGILQAGMRTGHFSKELDIESAAVGFWGIIQSLVTVWSLSGFRYPLGGRRLNAVFHNYINGISPNTRRSQGIARR